MGMGLWWLCVCVCVCVCLCEKPNDFNQSNSVHYDTSPPKSCVRTTVMFGSSSHCGLSALSARHEGTVQSSCAYRTLQPACPCADPYARAPDGARLHAAMK